MRNREITGLEMKREGSMHLVPAPAVRLMKSRVTSRPGNKVYNLEFFFPFSSRICDAEIFPLYHRNEFTNVQVIHC